MKYRKTKATSNLVALTFYGDYPALSAHRFSSQILYNPLLVLSLLFCPVFWQILCSSILNPQFFFLGQPCICYSNNIVLSSEIYNSKSALLQRSWHLFEDGESTWQTPHTCQGQTFLSQPSFVIHLMVLFIVKQLMHYLGKWQEPCTLSALAITTCRKRDGTCNFPAYLFLHMKHGKFKDKTNDCRNSLSHSKYKLVKHRSQKGSCLWG